MVDTDDTRRTTDDGRRTTPRVWHKLPTGELKRKQALIEWKNLYSCTQNSTLNNKLTVMLMTPVSLGTVRARWPQIECKVRW